MKNEKSRKAQLEFINFKEKRDDDNTSKNSKKTTN